MSSVDEIRTAIERLAPEEAARLLAWFEEYAAEQWDRQIEGDAEAGKLDALADEALRDHKAGRTRPL